jgi:chemotaxis methyl-accepting protein methylase
MTQGDFDFFRGLIREISGIFLSDAKKELLKSRLSSRIDFLGCKDPKGYRKYLEGLPGDHHEWQELINLVTTNKTDWFREPQHFNYLIQEYLPRWKQNGHRELSVWSAATATGEEPYSLAMVLDQELRPPYSYKILATDIDTQVLEVAKNGVYSRSKLEEIPEPYRESSLLLGTGDISGWMKINPALKRNIKFEQFNLTESRCPRNFQFDIIFCRNVLIYFQKDVIHNVINLLYEAAAPGAMLFIGHAESLQNIKSGWKFIRPSIFLKSS